MTPDKRSRGTFPGVRRIIATLRGPEGCPWDRVQTHSSLRPYLLEESHEALDALYSSDPSKLCEELGDLLFQVLIHVQLAEEAGEFTMRDVLAGISDKLIRRHPHVFDSAVAETPEEVIEQWDDLKARERGDQSALAGIPPSLPALAYAQALQRRAAAAGFADQSMADGWRALQEDLGELRDASTPAEQAKGAGDALLALANLIRRLDIDAEGALATACHGFTDRFQRMERIIESKGLNLREATHEDRLALWEEAQTSRMDDAT